MSMVRVSRYLTHRLYRSNCIKGILVGTVSLMNTERDLEPVYTKAKR